jgi:transcriptional regulator with XRE-family HTH domain
MGKMDKSPELFAVNIKTLMRKFKRRGFTQDALAERLDMTDTSTLRKYLSGTTQSLKKKNYSLTARYMIEEICQTEDDTDKLFKLAKMEAYCPEPFDYTKLHRDESLLDSVSQKLMYAMRDRDFSPPKQTKEQPPAPRSGEGGGGSKRKRIAVAAAALLIVIFGGGLLYNQIFQKAPEVALEITGSNAIGERDSFVTGTVTVSRGSPDDYAVTMAIVSPADGRVYAPKPSLERPSVLITRADKRGVGNFTCVFSIDSADAYARELYVYVVPADFVPSQDVGRTEKAAVAFEKYIRD